MQQLFIDGVTASRTGNNKKAISNMRQVLISGNSDLKKKQKFIILDQFKILLDN